jgi:hypothetical protein
MQVFAQIAQDTRRQIIEHRAQQIEQRTGHTPFPNGLPPTRQQRESGSLTEPTWDPEGSEKASEAARQNDMPTDLNRIQDDSAFASSSSTPAPRQKNEGRQEISRATRGTWDQIRQKTFGKTESEAAATGFDPLTPDAVGGGRKDERSREQREFDEMLEKERQGAAVEDKWA